MNYKIGDRASWRAVNRSYTGEIIGFRGTYAIARITGTEKVVLLQNQPITKPKIK